MKSTSATSHVAATDSVPLLSSLALNVSVPGRLLVANLTLELRSGELLAVLGQNGAGKTLSLLTLAGLRAPDAGQVLCPRR